MKITHGTPSVQGMSPADAASSAQLTARVLSRRRLFYSEGADTARDRPRHARAGSGCAFIDIPGVGRRLAVVQDDARFIALVDCDGARVDCLELPAGRGGARQFDVGRGNKTAKLDLESICTLTVDGAPALLAMGSGSAAGREVFVLACFTAEGTFVEEFPARAFFARLHGASAFSGGQLNVEGMAVIDDTRGGMPGGSLRLFNRGNGASSAFDATCDVPLAALLAYLRDPVTRAAPGPDHIIRYDLGTAQQTRMTFTDATATQRGLLFVAAAEASPNAIDDGVVVGTAVGLIRDDGSFVQVPNPFAPVQV